MKNLINLTTAFVLLFVTVLATAQNNNGKMDTLSYSVGILVGSNLASQGIKDVEVTDLAIGLSDAMNGGNLRISMEEANQVLQAYVESQQSKLMAEAVGEGAAFLEANAKREGVITTASGLQYEVLKKGEGPKPGLKDKVTTHYHGTLLDGSVFDSSYDRGQPASFPVSGVIAGWTEALQMMPVGSKWRLYVPYDLAYGERGAGGKIKPYATLIFDVELLSID